MRNEPRRHHYVPQFYLAGFTKAGTKDGHLYVLDKQLRKQWGPVTPNYVAHIPDFYRIDAKPDADPMVIEKTLGEIEAKCSGVIYRIIELRQLPTGIEHDILMNFVALMATRVPSIRSTISTGIDNVTKGVFRTMLSTEAGRRWFAEHCGNGSGETDSSFNEMKAFIDSDDYTIDMDRSWHVGMMLELGSQLVPVLAQRNWAIWILKDDSPDLVCSDNPLSLMWYMSKPGPLPPAFTLHGTAAVMPIGRRIAIAGTFEEQPPRSFLDKYDVGIVNRAVLEQAHQVYSSETEFEWALTEEHLGNATDLLDMLKNADQGQ